MKKLIIFLMIIMVVNTLAKRVTKEEQVNEEKIDFIPEPPVLQPINYGFPICLLLTETKCVIYGFKVDGKEANEAEKSDLKHNVDILNKYVEKGTIDIIGHTDSTGSEKHNLKLSLIRARNVAKLLREYGLDKRFSIGKVIGKGESSPEDTNETVHGRFNNRRVEILLNNVEYKKDWNFIE